MPQVALFMGPMARKKRVSSRYDPNTFRIISCEAESHRLPPMEPLNYSNMLSVDGEPGKIRFPTNEHRQNRPNPTNVGFLRDDVRLLMGPVCDVHTCSTAQEQGLWWPSKASSEPLKVPDKCMDTTMRTDYEYRGAEVPGNKRHSANTQIEPALGSVPVNFLTHPTGKRVWKEGISYEHQYNSRLPKGYPNRGKRHGSFVWDPIPTEAARRMMEKYGSDVTQNQSPASAVSPQYGYVSDKLRTSDSPHAQAYCRSLSAQPPQPQSDVTAERRGSRSSTDVTTGNGHGSKSKTTAAHTTTAADISAVEALPNVE